MSALAFTSAQAAIAPTLQWVKLPSLPDREGFAGPFAGVHNGALIVAGGANFPDKRPWEGGTKIWYDSVFVLETPTSRWQTGFKLPRPLGYGVSLNTANGILCVGGSDSSGHHTGVFLMKWEQKAIRFQELPKLPRSCANMCGALVGNTVYVAGGLEKADSTNTLKTFWTLDLTTPSQWHELEPWPGPARMLATAGAMDGSFYLFGGAGLKVVDGKVVREWLRDAYKFTPGKGWNKITDLPRAVVAAPSPAPGIDAHLLAIGGDDGTQVATPPLEHRGFPRDVLAYDCRKDTWKKVSEAPFSLVTTVAVPWNQQIVVPGGETRPGIRSTEVWAGKNTHPSNSK